ncbi:response regulator [Lyngbya aestuarii]|uniref:response regulator n=1 Tax=Lyngbya aestuarii TaxID=118322 RepID=UPI00403E2CA1
MSQDAECEVRLKFLDEINEHLNTIESVLLGLTSTGTDSQQMDGALRAAHTVKGIGSMIGCHSLSDLAHHLEDYLKILKVRRRSIQVDIKLETLLLQGVDCLRQVSSLHRQEQVVQQQWLDSYAKPIFEQLRERLGELQDSDEAALLSEDEEADIAVVMFESEVEGLLQRLEAVLADPHQSCLREELDMMAQELGELGQMLQLEAFISLCASIHQQLAAAPPEGVEAVALKALKAWQRSHALVVMGKREKLPTQIEPNNPTDDRLETSVGDIEADLTSTVFSLTTIPEKFEEEAENFNSCEFSDQAETVDFNSSELPNLEAIEDLDFSELQEVIANFDPSKLQLESEHSSFNTEAIPIEAIEVSASSTTPKPQLDYTPAAQLQEAPENTVRVPVKLLVQLNDLFGELIIQRNSLNSRLKEVDELFDTFRYRMRSLELSNTQLQVICNQLATEGAVPPSSSHDFSSILRGKPMPSFWSKPEGLVSYQSEFDILEMDRYSNLHLLSQEQRETVVQLQEVTGDIKLSMRGAKQTLRELNRSAKELQVNVTQARMRPLSDIVERFPRVVRDLSVQYGKTVELRLYGSSTLIDRVILEALKDPLMHLLRNAFDHGIEDPATRRAMGKSPQGTIEIRAVHRGNHTLIEISDDGGGINLNKIRDRARQIGIDEFQLNQFSEAELLSLIFEPGFSTAGQVSALSGRGIGMDVVHTNLEQVRGDIKVDTQPGVGTTFTITIPFTLSIVRVLLVESGGMRLAFPTDAISEMVRFKTLDHFTSLDQEFIDWEGLTLPLIRLEQWLKFRRPGGNVDSEASPTISEPLVLIVSQGNDLQGIYVDRFWREQEVVIRQVENIMGLPSGFSGCTILENGQVVPLADVSKMLEWIASIGSSSSSSQPEQKQLQHSLESENNFLEPITTQPQRDTILVVDDSINMRQFLATTLEKAGYQVEQAKDGQVAVDKLLSGLSVQAVICDIEMPRLDGYGLLTEVKSHANFQELPIIMLTSRSSEKHRQLAMRLGAIAYFTKPYEEQELLQTIKQLIKNSTGKIMAQATVVRQ